MTAVDASLTHDTPIAPATLQQWRPYIPEHIDPTASPAPGGHCECPTVAHIVLHVDGCVQGVSGRAQPYDPDLCGDYDLPLNKLVDAAELGAALRGITVGGLADVMRWEAEDRALDVHAAKSAYEAGVAEGESEAEALFETLRKRLPVEQYDAVLDGLDMNDPGQVLERLRAEVAALPAPFTVPPAPGAGQALTAAPDVADSSAAPEVEDDEEQEEVEPDRTIRDFDGTPPAADQIMKYPMPPIPAHVPPVEGAKTQPVEVLPPLANQWGHQNVAEEWIFSATPGLSHVAAAADARGVTRWGLLGTLLTRVAATIPPTVRLIPASRKVPTEAGATPAGTSINLYSIAVSPPSTGKTDTISAAAALIPGVRTVPPGTGEGMLKEFPRLSVDEDDSEGDGDGTAPKIETIETDAYPGSVLLESDEIDVFVGEMMRQGSKTTGWYRSMWMGGEIGNTVSDRDRRSFIAAHTYRFGIMLGAQPDAVAPMFNETSKGTPQRFMWLPAQQTIARGDYPSRLGIAPVYWFDESPSMIPSTGGQRPPVWIYPPKAATDALDRARWRAATANPMASPAAADRAAAIADRHAVLQQLKVSAVLAVLDGLDQPQDAHWYAAGAIMTVRRRVIHELVAESDRIKAEGKEAEGALNGVYRASSDAARDAERERHVSRCAARMMAGLVKASVAGQPPMTYGAAIRLLSGKKGAAGRSDRELYGRAALAVVRASPGVADTGTHVQWVGTAAI
ncbi:hypothetical protein B9M79_04010 [Mycobacteroides abscessus]|nr:hypothetical protein AOY11_25240 [Mycobacteroides abscessus]AMU49430.1 hypothetical protein A3O01_04180 [Mycobacteroides abscessus]ANO08103.1 hypothetical protein BAB76_04180 [Mycobacteroides abscessus]OTR33702.1 hypothetical protein B9M79_04010 [Mycobacteroides abscessus]PVA29250.1 hypothetical protein DDJ36_16635 [Mycobacteroides abscessus]